MGRLIYSMITSLDGYAKAAEGDLGAGAEVPEVHTFIGDVFRDVRTFLYGRRMYETMRYWETADDEDPVARDSTAERVNMGASFRMPGCGFSIGAGTGHPLLWE